PELVRPVRPVADRWCRLFSHLVGLAGHAVVVRLHAVLVPAAGLAAPGARDAGTSAWPPGADLRRRPARAAHRRSGAAVGGLLPADHRRVSPAGGPVASRLDRDCLDGPARTPEDPVTTPAGGTYPALPLCGVRHRRET